MDALDVFKISKKILKLEEELDHYDWEIFRKKELDPDDEIRYRKLKAKRNKLKEKLKNHLPNC